VKQPQIGFQKLLGLVIAILNDPSDLGINLNGRAFGIIHLLSEVSAQKYLFLFFSERHWSELFTHTPLTDHAPRQIRRFFDVVSGAGGHMIEDELLGRAA